MSYFLLLMKLCAGSWSLSSTFCKYFNIKGLNL